MDRCQVLKGDGLKKKKKKINQILLRPSVSRVRKPEISLRSALMFDFRI